VVPQNSNIDEKMIALIIEGDESAFTEFYAYYHPMVYGIALKITHSTALSEEIVQEVFLKIWLKRSDLASIENIAGYLFIIARNHVFKVLKQIARNYKTILLEENDNVFAHNNLENTILEKENNLLLHKAIERLPHQQKQVYNLIKDQGLKREEAAEILKLKPETIKFHLAQAMKNIRSYCAFHLDLIAVLCLFFITPE
jgi:RNA polymerase sigma-70 factor (ECF subfamily)